MNLPTKITFSRIIATIVLIVALFVLSLIPNLQTPELGNTRINLIFLIVFVFFVIASYASTILSGIGFGFVAQHWGWNAAYATILAAAIVGGLVLMFMWKAPAEQRTT